MTKTTKRKLMQTVRLVMAALGAALLLALMNAPAQAAFSVTGFGGSATNPDGTRNAQAGAHPDFTTRLDFRTLDDAGTLPDGNVKDVVVELPPGVLGNPTAAPQCRFEQLRNDTPFDPYAMSACPVDTQVGFASVGALGSTIESGAVASGIFNLVPPRGMPALFGFNIFGTVVLLAPELRGSDYGLTVRSLDTSQSLPITGVKLTLWGIPADPVHDPQRNVRSGFGYPSGLQPQAFMTAPTNCAAGPLTTTVKARSWQDQEHWIEKSFSTDFDGNPMQVEGCETVPFVPSFTTATDTSLPDAPAGLAVKLAFPQDGLTDPTGTATSPLRKASVTLPEGMTINPASADGLTACTDAQLGLGDNEEAQCASSRRSAPSRRRRRCSRST